MNLKVQVSDFIATITLNRPKFKNALNIELINDLCSLLLEIKTDKKYKDIRVILLTGAESSFCAGGDIKNMKTSSGMFSGDSNQLRENYEQGIQKIPILIESIDIPIIALVNGAAIGAGCDLACMCDIRICSDKAMFAETFSKLNLVPGDGGTFFLQRIVGYSKAMELFLTGDIVSPDMALDIGLVSKVTTSEKLLEEGMKLASKIANNGPAAIKMTKKALKYSRTNSLNDSLSLLSSYQGICQRMQDHSEGLNALFEKRDTNFKNE